MSVLMVQEREFNAKCLHRDWVLSLSLLFNIYLLDHVGIGIILFYECKEKANFIYDCINLIYEF